MSAMANCAGATATRGNPAAASRLNRLRSRERRRQTTYITTCVPGKKKWAGFDHAIGVAMAQWVPFLKNGRKAPVSTPGGKSFTPASISAGVPLKNLFQASPEPGTKPCASRATNSFCPAALPRRTRRSQRSEPPSQPKQQQSGEPIGITHVETLIQSCDTLTVRPKFFQCLWRNGNGRCKNPKRLFRASALLSALSLVPLHRLRQSPLLPQHLQTTPNQSQTSLSPWVGNKPRVLLTLSSPRAISPLRDRWAATACSSPRAHLVR